MNKYKEQLDYYVSLINDSLPQFMPQKNTPYDKLIEAMEYSFLSGGKRIRGVFILAFYQLFGGIDVASALPFVAAIEMVHTYSLIHDDLPCMDDDELRRGKPSCHIRHGEATALLAGDALLTLAFETLTKEDNLSSFSTKQILDTVKVLSHSAGVNGMIGGQAMDLANEGETINVDRLERTDLLKTGELFTASAMVGSILGNASVDELKSVKIFARNIGLVFQMVDDILDVTATEKELGKPIKSDDGNKKQTYTTLHGIEQTKKLAEELTQEAVDALISTGKDIDFLKTLSEELINRTY